MSHPDSADLSNQLAALRERVARLEAEKANVARKRRWGLVAVFIGLVATGTALAADGNCPNALPFCFAPDTPAQASHVNTNFAQLHEWLVAKVGSPTAAGITTSSVAATGTISGTRANFAQCGANQCLSGNNVAGNFHIDTNTPTGGTYLNWFSGSGGVVFGAGNTTEVGRIDGRGFVAGGKRSPSLIVTNNCSAGTCTGSCPTGTVVKLAFGFHGQNTTTGSGPWACGSGFQWLGGCAGNSSCTVTTGCGSSGIFLECW